MKIYVASSWRNDFQPGVVAALRAEGHQVYDFKGPGDGWGSNGEGPGGFGWSEIDKEWEREWKLDIPRYLKALQHPRAVEGFLRDMDALEESDACVMVMPCGPSASMEMGWSVGAGHPTVVYIPAMREPDLMVKMAQWVTNDLASVVAFLRHEDMHQITRRRRRSRTRRNPSYSRRLGLWERFKLWVMGDPMTPIENAAKEAAQRYTPDQQRRIFETAMSTMARIMEGACQICGREQPKGSPAICPKCAQDALDKFGVVASRGPAPVDFNLPHVFTFTGDPGVPHTCQCGKPENAAIHGYLGV